MKKEKLIIEAESKIVELQKIIKELKQPEFKKGDVLIDTRDGWKCLYILTDKHGLLNYIVSKPANVLNFTIEEKPSTGLGYTEFYRLSTDQESKQFHLDLLEQGYRWNKEKEELEKSLTIDEMVEGEFYFVESTNNDFNWVAQYDSKRNDSDFNAKYFLLIKTDEFKSNSWFSQTSKFISKATPEQIELIKSKIPKRWRAEAGDKYYFIDASIDAFVIKCQIEYFMGFDNYRFDSGNYAQTKEELQPIADEFNNKLLLRTKI